MLPSPTPFPFLKPFLAERRQVAGLKEYFAVIVVEYICQGR